VTQAHLKNIPSHYQRKQTMVGAERFFTPELKKFEEDILTAATQQKILEQSSFKSSFKSFKINALDHECRPSLGELDSLASLAQLSQRPNWSFPKIEDGLDLEIQSGRHPMVDLAKQGVLFPTMFPFRLKLV
jgi:DNA mismatch repair protein MutS